MARGLLTVQGGPHRFLVQEVNLGPHGTRDPVEAWRLFRLRLDLDQRPGKELRNEPPERLSFTFLYLLQLFEDRSIDIDGRSRHDYMILDL